MKDSSGKTKDFVQFPRRMKDDYLSGKITFNEYIVLNWIWVSTNPYNGYFSSSYRGLTQDLRGNIGYDNARKIISSLRKSQYIYFSNHKGRSGSFPIYPVGFRLTNGTIQDLEYLKNKLSITTEEAIQSQPDSIVRQQFNSIDHNLEEIRKNIFKDFP